MPFTIEQISSLELIDKNGEIVEISPGKLEETGDHEVVSELQFKEDREERQVVFLGEIEQGKIKVKVTYSVGVDGHEVQDVDVEEIPDGLEVHSAPKFETLEYEDDDL